MNKQRLQDIANNTAFVNDNDLAEIKELIGKFTFYPLPHVVLAKIFFEKEHYLFENALTQAAMRVSDREWLYHYVHGDGSQVAEVAQQGVANTKLELEKDLSIQEQEPVTAMSDEEVKTEIVEENIVVKNDLSAFLVDIPDEDLLDEDPEQKIADEVVISKESADELPNNTSEEEIVAEAEIPEVDQNSVNVEDADTINIAMNLRKHPVYNVEAFLKSDSIEKTSGETEERDFFYWLEHPHHEEKKSSESEREELKQEIIIPEKDSRLSIIDQFIQANPAISRPKREFFNAENMAKKSEQLNTDFVTETLANIFYEQGNMDMAIDAYEKLSLQNPLKQAYFASLIEKIKKEKR